MLFHLVTNIIHLCMKYLTKNLLGQRVKLLRKKANLTQEELAKAVNRTRVSIVILETGKMTPPLNLLLDIRTALSKEVPPSIDYLVGITDELNYQLKYDELKIKYSLLQRELETCQKISALQEELLKRK